MSNREKEVKELISKIKSGEMSLSYSSLSKFKKSPRAFIDYKLEPFEQTEDMLIGSVMHTLVLEPTKFDEKYATDHEICAQIGGASPRATKVYKEWKSKEEEKGIKVLSYKVFSTAEKMANALLTNKASKFLLDQLTEVEQTYHFELGGFKFKSILDGRSPDFIIDLKKCTDADPQKFRRDIIYRGYWIQSGVYEFAVDEIIPYYILAVDGDGEVSVHNLMEDFIIRGMEEFKKLVEEFKHCIDNEMFDYSYNYRGVTKEGFYKMDVPPFLP